MDNSTESRDNAKSKAADELYRRLSVPGDTYVSIIRDILEQYPELASTLDITLKRRTPLILAAEKGSSYIVSLILDKPKFNVMAKDIDGYTALDFAVIKSHRDIALRILSVMSENEITYSLTDESRRVHLNEIVNEYRREQAGLRTILFNILLKKFMDKGKLRWNAEKAEILQDLLFQKALQPYWLSNALFAQVISEVASAVEPHINSLLPKEYALELQTIHQAPVLMLSSGPYPNASNQSKNQPAETPNNSFGSISSPTARDKIKARL